MSEHIKAISSPVPNEISQSEAQHQSHPSDHAAPLHERLPLEIFADIIHLCVGFSTPVRDLVTLQLVCRSWHDIIAGASFLWGTINATEGLPAVRKALKIAKDSLIDLNILESGIEIDQTEFFKLAREKINQWRSFVLESREWETALADLRSKKPPNLETLHLVKHSFTPWGREEIVLFGGDPAPGLKDVRFVNVPVNRAPLQLSGLKSLRLESMPSVSAAEVITLITASPGLEILHLVTLGGAVLLTEATPSQTNFASGSSIELAFLIELKLLYLPLPLISHLLLTVSFPQLRSLLVGCDPDENPVLQLGETLGLNRLNPSMNSIASGAQMYKVAISSWGYYAISIGGLNIDIPFFWGELSLDKFLETFTWLSGHLEQSLHDLPLHLNLENCDPEPSHLEWFTRHTNVTTLTLYSAPDYGPSLQEITSILGRPTSPPPSPPNWLLPHAEVLHTNLVCRQGDLAIVGMVEARHAASRGSSAVGPNRVLPKPFREIRLTYGGMAYPPPPPDTEYMSKVVQAAEGADVYWEGKKWVGS